MAERGSADRCAIDTVEIARIERLLAQTPAQDLAKLFSAQELADAGEGTGRAASLAARFAAKEAAMKALGTGHALGVLWKDIEVFRSEGPPQLRLHGGAARRAATMRVTRSLLTITHSESLAMAQVLLFGPLDSASGAQPCRMHSAAAVPAACPSKAQVAITRVEESAACVTEMLRSANNRFGTFAE